MPTSRRTFITLPIVVAAASLAPATAFGRRNARSVVICLSLDPETLDPTMAASAAIGAVVHGNIFEGLTKLQENGIVEPLLAESWTVSPEGTRYKFHLKKNVRFHDGARFDAETVKFSFERAKQADARNKLQATLFNNIVDILIHDVHTVELILEYPDPNLLFRLAENPAVILHPRTAGQASHHPVGTGPYMFATRTPGDSITLKKWPDHRRAASIQIDIAEFRFIAEPEEQVRAVLDGHVDNLFNYATPSITRFLSSDRYEVLIGTSTGKTMLALNRRRPPLHDRRVRQAITHAIDREGYIRRAMNGHGRAIGSHFAPTEPGYLNLSGTYAYDPERSRELLRDAGVARLHLVLSLPPTPYARAGGPLVAEALADVGIDVTLENVSWPQWLAGPFAGDFDITLINHVEPLDYHIYTRPDYYFGYDSASYRELVARHQRSGNPREQRMLFQQIQRHLANDAANVWLASPQIATVVRKGLKGVWMNYPIYMHDIAAMYWE